MKGGPAASAWTRVATYDVDNIVTTVWDKKFRVELGALVEQPVQFGTNSGIKLSHTLTANPLDATALVNGKPYYFAVTAYAVNLEGTPRYLESAQELITVTPQKPVLDEQVNVDTDLALEVVHTTGVATFPVTATVVDPAQVTGHDYRVVFGRVMLLLV